MSSTYHLDMVRGRLTCQEGKTNQQYTGIVHAYKEIIRTVRSARFAWSRPAGLSLFGKRGHPTHVDGRVTAEQMSLCGTRGNTGVFRTSARQQQ